MEDGSFNGIWVFHHVYDYCQHAGTDVEGNVTDNFRVVYFSIFSNSKFLLYFLICLSVRS